MTRIKTVVALLAVFLSLPACVPNPGGETDMGIAWVRDAAEFRALSLQAYGQAGRDLENKLADLSWSALPGQVNASELTPAIILDVDETSVSNVGFQETLVQPFKEENLNRWSNENLAKAIPGAVEFVEQAAAAGVAVFFVTNRACVPGAGEHCPQEQVVIDELREAGFTADKDNVMLASERPEWTKEKSVRRNHIAGNHRVIMLFGDDLGDFIDCTRKRPLDPCTVGATRTGRHADVDVHADYWGNGWYVLPNPMHGS